MLLTVFILGSMGSFSFGTSPTLDTTTDSFEFTANYAIQDNVTDITTMMTNTTAVTPTVNMSSTTEEQIDQGTAFLQTAAAQGIAGLFSFTAMLITCHQVIS